MAARVARPWVASVSAAALAVCCALAAAGPLALALGAAQAPVTPAPAAPRPGRYPLPAESSTDAATIAHARALVTELVRAKALPGLSAAVARDGRVIWSEGFGVADLEQGVRVTPLTRFRIGSVSKLIAVAAVATLVEQGRLDLDAPVQRYVPGFPAKAWPVTTRQLTGHLAGIRHYERDFDGPLKGAPHFASVDQALAIFRDDPLRFQPGTRYAYSSYGYNLVSAVVEGASGEEFLRYVQRAVLEPLGLHHTSADHVDAIVPHRTRFYRRTDAGAIVHAPYVDNSYKWAGGGMLSTPEDLVRLGSAHLVPGFLRMGTLDVLFTSQRLADGKETGVGIGWRVGADAKGRRIRHHGGTIDGGRAMLMAYPDSRVVVAIVSNMLADFGEREAQQIGELFIR